MAAPSEKLWRARELTSSAVVLLWAGFHLYEQWSAFGGRARFVEQMSSTSLGGAALLVEVLLGVLPIAVWLVLEVRLAIGGGEPPALAGALAEQPELARRLARIVRGGSWIFLAFLIVHVAWLWAPKLGEGAEPLRTWMRLRTELGTWPLALAHALGLTGFLLHAAAAPVRIGIVLGGLPTPESRRAARLSGLIVALGVVILFAQLVGWHAAGTGTVWSM